MEEVGLQFLVEGLAAFGSDVAEANGLLDSLRPKATALEKAFNSVSDSVQNFGKHVMNVIEYALGRLLADAIEGAIKLLKDFALSALEAGSDFQLLSLRLQGMNLQTLVDSGMEYTAAMREAIAVTKEQMNWIMRLAALTPYDAVDIANTFTLARSYGFTADESQRLTESILDFTAAMGLDSVAQERVIVNFGQMIQRGKITTREMNDLARGSMVPLADVLQRVADNMGITVEELTKMIQTTEGVPAEEFINAFMEMTEQEVRFAGAADRMARTLKGASENIRQTIRDLLGFYIVKPVFDFLGEQLATFLDELLKPEKWKKIIHYLDDIGDSVLTLVKGILGLAPSAEEMADGLIGGLKRVADWLDDNKGRIVDFFTGLKQIISGMFPNLFPTPELPPATSGTRPHGEIEGSEIGPKIVEILPGTLLGDIQKIATFITDTLIPAFNEIKKWVTDNKELIKEFFASLGDIVSMIFTDLFGGVATGEGGVTGGLEALKGFMQFVIDNKDQIADIAAIILKLWFYFEMASLAIQLVIGFFSELLGLVSLSGFASLMAFFAAVAAFNVSEFAKDPSAFAEGFKKLFSAVDLKTIGSDLAMSLWEGFMEFIKKDYLYNEFKNTMIGKLSMLGELRILSIGNDMGMDIARGLAQGITDGTTIVITAITTLAQRMIAQMLAIFDQHSPSRVFANIGQNTMLGLAQGIEEMSGMVTSTMANAVNSMMVPALTMPAMAYANSSPSVSTAYNTNNNFNLAIHSNARTEPIIADFGLMASLIGG